MDNLWQSPYVNVFKHFNLTGWKKATKEGDVTSYMDKTVKGTVFRIVGSIPAGNYIHLPKTSSQLLGLTGRYFYLQFKPVPSKHFVVHIDVATTDNLIIRISFSNLFKTFKSTSTWLQFPFICCPLGNSLPSYAVEAKKDQSGAAPLITKWTLLCLDLQQILSSYLNRKFLYIKSFKLCANMLVKNVFTSDQLFDPDLTLQEAKRHGLMAHNICPLPREMSFPVGKGENWHDLYDLIRFPTDLPSHPFDTIQVGGFQSKSFPFDGPSIPPVKAQTKTVDVSKCVSDRVSMIHKLTSPRQKPDLRKVTKELPELAPDSNENYTDEIHVYAHLEKHKNSSGKQSRNMKHSMAPSKKLQTYKALEPDPIMKLKRIIGFGGATYQNVIWSTDESSIIYPCHAVVVSMKISTGQQRFFTGHTDKVSCLALNTNTNLLASGQTGSMSTVKIWKYTSGECVHTTLVHDHGLSSLSFSSTGAVLCGLGLDGHNKNLIVVWNTSKVQKTTVLAKAHTDVDIARIIFAPFDETRLVSCGKDNVRVWRVKEGVLRSAPVNLGEYHSMEFTDICFELYSHNIHPSVNQLVYACTKSGHIFEIDYSKLAIHHVRRLLPLHKRPGKSTKLNPDADSSAATMSINSIHLNDTFCVTGSDDGYLRLWPLDFAHVYLEAEHEGPVTITRLSADGLKIIAGTASGNLGVLDVTTRQYTTLMRSHTGSVLCFALDPVRKQLATASADNTIRVWDVESLQQLYDFSAPDECPCSINYHPHRQIFACGFHNGTIRIFNVETTSLLAEHRQLRGQVTGLVYSPDGNRLYASCSLGVASVFDASSLDYKVIRVIAGLVAKGNKYGPQALAVSSCGRRVAFVGPTELTVTVADAKCLDELVRIDVSNMNAGISNLDSAERVTFSPASLGHLIVTTANNKLIKYDARTGRLIQEIDHINRSGCSALTVSDCGHYLATGGDKTIKIWDYELNLDINFQVFIGHSENVSRILFTPDGLNLISSGEAIYIWNFLVKRSATPPIEGRMLPLDEEVLSQAEGFDFSDEKLSNVKHKPSFPLKHKPSFPQPKPTRLISPRSDDIDGLSSIDSDSKSEDTLTQCSVSSQSLKTTYFQKAKDLSGLNHSILKGGQQVVGDKDISSLTESLGGNATLVPNRPQPTSVHKSTVKVKDNGVRSDPFYQPSVFVHYKQREKASSLAQKRYAAPPDQAGLKLSSVIGYNSNGRNNMVWHPNTGLFAYTSGCIIIIEDLNTGEQKHLIGHTEEVSCLALRHDSSHLVSASSSFRDTPCQMCIWDTKSQTCIKTLLHHTFGIQSMAFSQDDRYLISIGDFRESNVVVWSTSNYQMVASSPTDSAMHSVKWDPFSVNEFVTVGDNATVLFWMLDETTADVYLNVHEAELPEDLQLSNSQGKSLVFTSLAYAGDSTVYIGTNLGRVTAWDTRQNTCFMHWEADTAEITRIVSRYNQLMTASYSKCIRIWSVGRVSEMKMTKSLEKASLGLTMEDEMTLDDPITCAEFDDTLEMGIVGTSSGTLWYINWTERTSIILVSGHKNKINSVIFVPNNLMVSGGDDGSVRVWSLKNREQVLQFKVMNQSSTCLASGPADQKQNVIPLVLSGYSDGTIRIFDVNKAEMVLKMHPHAVTVTAIAFSSDGLMILSGSSDGLLAVSSPTSGITVTIINDHRGAAISNIDVILAKDLDFPSPSLWLASSLDRRVSVWSADWDKDVCELVDWLTFPAPAVMPDGSRINRHDQAHYNLLPPTIAKFSPDEPDIIVYASYGMEKSLLFYSLTHKKIMRTMKLTHWASSLAISPDSSLIAVGVSERLLKLLDYNEGSFQDFTNHTDCVSLVQFSPKGTVLVTVSHNELFVWDVTF
ncbi:WD repeat-containing protein 90 [Biomphalaria glabrata]|uniref:WD repeat-containing protein 90-like n=1 Tax=Biomphalaria glabrata TaxID=6526 RepID=A0A9W2ZNL2_BIOGL|nr:WD repeat-containing protein 90-like [Biomphalaria glabrata]KAI8765400.1 WD repeat-containing protein 90-like [Biomphalaria glabrata]